MAGAMESLMVAARGTVRIKMDTIFKMHYDAMMAADFQLVGFGSTFLSFILTLDSQIMNI